MSEIIQCPTCDKKFRLPDHPPAEFTCSKCQTVMDLSGFGGAAPEPAGAASGAPASRRQRASGAGRRSSRAARSRGGGGRRGRGAPPPEDYADDGGRRGYQKEKDNTMMVAGSIAAVAALVVLVIVLMKDDEPEPVDPNAGGGTTVAGSDTSEGVPGFDPVTGLPIGGAAGAPAAGTTPVAGTAPAGGTDPAAGTTAPKPIKSKRPPKMKDIKLQRFEWPDEVDDATRAEAETHIENLWIGGRDGRDAEEWFIAQGNKVAGRLISEFPRIEEERGLDHRLAKTDLMVLDRTLSKMDGYLARKWGSKTLITSVSEPAIIIRRLKRWTAWFDAGYWKERVEPWDPRVDEIDESEGGKKPNDDKPKGFGDRAGK